MKDQDLLELARDTNIREQTYKFNNEWDLCIEIHHGVLNISLQNYEGEIIPLRETRLINRSFVEMAERQIRYFKYEKTPVEIENV